jgi:hypothetical protein
VAVTFQVKEMVILKKAGEARDARLALLGDGLGYCLRSESWTGAVRRTPDGRGLLVWPIILGRVFWKGYAKDPVKEARELDHSWSDADHRTFKELMKQRPEID